MVVTYSGPMTFSILSASRPNPQEGLNIVQDFFSTRFPQLLSWTCKCPDSVYSISGHSTCTLLKCVLQEVFSYAPTICENKNCTDHSEGGIAQFHWVSSMLSDVPFNDQQTLGIGVPHLSLQDDVYNGMYIPKGTIMIPNIR